MWPFKKKKIYKVEYEDCYRILNSCIVKAYDEYGAWKAVEKRYEFKWTATRCISIIELKTK